MKLEKRTLIHKVKGEDGFNLIEVLIAVTILSYGILAVATMQAYSLRGTQLAYNYTEGTGWAQEKLEGLMTRSYSHSDLSSGSHEESQGDYTVTWTVTVSSPITNTKSIDVDVTWTASGGAKKVSSLQFIRADII